MDEDDNFYSAMAAGAGGDEDSDVSDADVAALTKALSDMDGMDDALFTSSLKNRKTPTLKSGREDKPRTLGRGSLAATRTLSPPSLTNTTESRRGTFTIKEESPPGESSKTSPRNRPILKKPPTKSFDFGEFDEDDPLGGLLSDEEEDHKPVKGPARKAQPTPEPKPRERTPPAAETPPTEGTKDKTPPASPRSPHHRERRADDDIEEPLLRSKSAPPPRRTATPKRTDDIDFDDDDILGTMGFDDSPPQNKKETPKSMKKDDEIKAAKSKVADLFGRKSATLPPPEKPPLGKPKEFVLDSRYKKTERGKPKKGMDEEDFSFGSYTPSAVNTHQRPDSAPPGRRSVRFADDVDDLFGGTSTLDRPSRGGGRQRSSSQGAGPSRKNESDVSKDRDGDDDDWLSLAIGRKAEHGAPASKPGEAGGTDGGSPELSEDVSQGIEKSDVGEGDESEEVPARPASAGDYLGLGEDIDLDTLLSSKPAVGPGESRRRDTRSSLPWDEPPLDMTAGLGSTMDSQLLGGTLSSEDNDTQSSGVIARQVAEMDRLEQEAMGTQNPLTGPASPGRSNQLTTEADLPQRSAEQPLQTGGQPPRTLDQPSGAADEPSRTVNQPPGTPSKTSPLRQPESKREGSIGGDHGHAAEVIQPSRDPQAHHQTVGPLTHQGPGMPVDGYGVRRAGIDGAATLPARGTSPGSPRGARKEPRWRQELRLRQEQMQAAPQPTTEAGHHGTPSEVRGREMTNPAGIPVSGIAEPPVGHSTPSPAPLAGGVAASNQQFQEQMRLQQQRRAEELEQAVRDQQAQLKAQQEEQMRQMQKLQQEAMQQQLLMQQQLQMQSQHTLPPVPPSMTSFQGGNPFPGMFRSNPYDSRIQQLEDEKRFLEASLHSLQEQHKQQMTAKEKANQEYVRLVEDSFRKKEERLRLEEEEQKRRYEERIDEMAMERGRLVAEHRREVEATAEKHRKDLEQVQQSVQAELRAVTEATGHSRSLQAVVDQVGYVGQELGTLQTKISGDHRQQLEKQGVELEEKDKQLKALQKNLEHQQEEMAGERTRLEAMVQRLEGQIRQGNTQLDQERWRLRQEQNKLSSLQAALDEERKLSAEQVAAQQVALQQARDSLSTEHQDRMVQCMEERKALATECAHIVRERKELDATIKKHMEKISRENAEREGRLAALMEDEKRVAMDLESLERQRQDQAKEKQRLEKEKMELLREQDKLQEIAENLRLRAQQVDKTVQDAVQVRQEGMSALELSRKTESEQRQREQGIQERLQVLRATERQIAQERLKQAEEERKLEQLVRDGLCLSCRKIPGHIKGSGEAFLLPITGGHTSHSYDLRSLHSHPASHNGGTQQVPSEEQLVDHLLSKAEFDHTFSVWHIAAEKDKDFLEEETSFLNSLIGPSDMPDL